MKGRKGHRREKKNMEILKLTPACKDYLWGGHRLAEEYGKVIEGDILAESWELSCHPDGASVISNGKWAGKTLKEYIETVEEDVLGTNCRRFSDFPILIKFIDAKDNLSIQVHPDNAYALKNEGQYGKTEMWYVVDAAEDAFLYYGFKDEISEEEFRQRIEEDTLLEVLNAAPVKKGDVFFIESGTIHAIGKNILIAEIQQNSNVTYRVYDYGRVGKDGKKRELHIEQAVQVTKRSKAQKRDDMYPHIADCDYFTVDKINLDGKFFDKMEGFVTEESFLSILVLDGEGTIQNQYGSVSYKKGDSLFLPAGSGAYQITGRCDALATTIREKTDMVRIGIDIGGTSAKVGIVNKENQVIAETKVVTGVEKAEVIIKNIAEGVLQLMVENGITIDQCESVGVGVPGLVNKKEGIVAYSNNLRWENVAIAKEFEKYIPLPVSIANDADCAALGEAVAGAGKGVDNLVMLTLGTGVGGGIILNGQLFEGSMLGGVELGHMVIHADGEMCTCGRKGCLEAYASATAMRREAEKAYGTSLEPLEIFQKAKDGDEKAQEIVDRYIEDLGTGIINIVNLLRPERIILGGGIAAQREVILQPIRERMAAECFGGAYSELPEMVIAEMENQAGMIGAANLK